MCIDCCKFVKLTPEMVHMIYGEAIDENADIVGSITNVFEAFPKPVDNEECEVWREQWIPKLKELNTFDPVDEYWTVWVDQEHGLWERK